MYWWKLRGRGGGVRARMTGGGFGGALWRWCGRTRAEGSGREIEAEYFRRTGRRTAAFATRAREARGSGTRKASQGDIPI